MKRNLLKTLLLVVLLLLAVVLGKLIGDVTASTQFLSWLGVSAQFGFQPITVDLSVVTLTFGFMIGINVAQAFLLLAAILIYTAIKIRD